MNKLLVVLLMAIPQLAMGAIGTISDQFQDPARITRKDITLDGVKGVGVEMKDQLRTGAGTLEITFDDDTQVQMTESAKLTIDDFVYDPKNKDAGKLAIKIASGTARYASGQIAKNRPQAVKIRTPSATVSVRGTDFTATVDEIGSTTVILLPSCPPGWLDIERDCVTGAIEVASLGGSVLMNKPFEATRVPNLEAKPTPPVIVDLTEEMIRQIIIVGPPKEFNEEERDNTKISLLDDNALDQNLLENELDKEEEKLYVNKLSENLLDRDFLQNVLDILDMQLAMAQARTLATGDKNELLPDYIPDQGVTYTTDGITIQLCMDTTGSDKSCITVSDTQETTIRQIQGAVDITNRVIDSGTTTITTDQN
jgi:hypothetical protein